MNGNLFATIEGRVSDSSRPFLVSESGAVFTYGDMLSASARYAACDGAARMRGSLPRGVAALPRDVGAGRPRLEETR